MTVMGSKIEILLVEDDKDMCEAFEFCIHRNAKFYLAGKTGKQSEGIELLKRNNIGAVILDLELEEGDGIHFLYELKELDIVLPLIVVITNTRSEVTLECMRASGADFIYQKCNESYSPNMVLSIIEHTYPYRKKAISPQMKVISYQQSQEELYQRRRIEDELVKLGFKIHTKATGYLVDAIHYTAFEIKEQEYVLKDVYSAVAKKNGTKDVNVEKAIRDNIERTWLKTNAETIERFYPYPVSKESGTPTNMEFIKNITRKMWKV